MFGNDIVHQQAWEIVRALHRSKASAVVDLRSLTATCRNFLYERYSGRISTLHHGVAAQKPGLLLPCVAQLNHPQLSALHAFSGKRH